MKYLFSLFFKYQTSYPFFRPLWHNSFILMQLFLVGAILLFSLNPELLYTYACWFYGIDTAPINASRSGVLDGSFYISQYECESQYDRDYQTTADRKQEEERDAKLDKIDKNIRFFAIVVVVGGIVASVVYSFLRR